jgi:hypothetical protein
MGHSKAVVLWFMVVLNHVMVGCCVPALRMESPPRGKELVKRVDAKMGMGLVAFSLYFGCAIPVLPTGLSMRRTT